MTRWMVDMAVAWRRAGGKVWFVVPRPTVPFASAGDRPTVLELLTSYPAADIPTVLTPPANRTFELGTEHYRAHIYARAMSSSIPAGVPVVVSDDPAAWAAAASMGTRNPLIGVLHSDGNNYYALGEKYQRAAAALICVSSRIETQMRSVNASFGGLLATIPCGTPLHRGIDRHARATVATLLWVGRIEEKEKRVSDLPKIADALRAAGVAFCLHIVGDGPDRAATESEVRRLGLDDLVRFHGWLSSTDVGALMFEADILLLPSNYEGMPIVVMEALGHGCAVVASRVSGVEDYEYHPRADACLLLHDVGDISAAAHHVQRLLGIDLDRRSSSARELAYEEFAIEVCMRRYASIVAAARATRVRAMPLTGRSISGLVSMAVSTQRRARLWMQRRFAGA